jgi:flagellar motor switch protein FliM
LIPTQFCALVGGCPSFVTPTNDMLNDTDLKILKKVLQTALAELTSHWEEEEKPAERPD